MRSFTRRNPSFVVFVLLAPGLVLSDLGAPGAGAALHGVLAAALAFAGERRLACAVAVAACVLAPRGCAARQVRLAELAAWREEPAGELEIVGRAEARGPSVRGRSRLLFRVSAAGRPVPEPGAAPASPGAVRPGGSSATAALPRTRVKQEREPPATPVELRPRTGWVRLYADSDPPPVGREVRVRGRFRPAPRAENPGSLDWGSLPGGPRVRGSLAVRSWTGGEGGPPPLQALRERLSARVERLFPPLSGGFMQAALFGDREGLSPRLREVFSRTGTGHIVAISGMNVAILAAIGWAGLTPLVPAAARRRRTLAAALLLYVPLGGSSPSVARAAVMGAGLLCAQSLGRRVALLNALGLAGLALLLVQPGALLDPSFQLSFVAVLGLAALPGLPGRALSERVLANAGRPAGGQGTRDLARAAAAALLGGALDLAAITLASLVSTLPLTLAYFRHLPLLSLPANLIVVPSLGALTAGGFAALLASLAWEPAGRLYARGCDLLLLGVFRALEACARPAWAWAAVPGPRGALAGGGLCVTALSAVALRAPRLRGRACAGAALLLVGGLVAAALPRSSRHLELAVLSVGQGDALALILPDGEALLVDGGPPEAGEAVLSFLHERGVRRLARVFATHPDADHAGGLERVLAELPADSVHDGGQWGAGSPYRRFLETSAVAGAGYRPLAAGESLRHGEVALDVLWPPTGFAGRDPYWEGLATNDAGLVMLLSYRGLRILLTGDAGAGVERRLAEAQGDSLRSEFLKVSHHGSRFSSEAEFLDRAGKGTALVSVGRGNRYGHPHAEALARLATRRTIWRTDLEGALLLASDGCSYALRGHASGRALRGELPCGVSARSRSR